MIAELGILPKDSYDMTIGEIIRYYRMYEIRQSKEWERARFISWFSTLPYAPKGSKTSPLDIMTLPTDPTEEELKEMKQRQSMREIEESEAIIQKLRERGYNV